jgi:hypothetical protein
VALLSTPARRTIPTRVGRTSSRPLPEPLQLGPSPREWGELILEYRPGHIPRTIPTRVGRTTLPAAGPVRVADHPHASGENFQQSKRVNRSIGPSPREWGELQKRTRNLRVLRTIPTRVGRTMIARVNRQSSADHPHASGENESVAGVFVHFLGPSPREWGELSQTDVAIAGSRTIPTRVGRTLPR